MRGSSWLVCGASEYYMRYSGVSVVIRVEDIRQPHRDTEGFYPVSTDTRVKSLPTYCRWAAAGLIDTILRSCSLPFELHRTEIPQGGVPPSGIVKALDVIKHVGFRLVSCAVRGPRRALGLQRREEAFHRRVVPAVAGAAHATSQALVCQKSLERLTGILAAPIGVMQHGLGLAPPPDRHHQRSRDQLRGHRGLHGPADDPPGEEIHDRRDVEPPFGGPEVGEVGHPFCGSGLGRQTGD